MTPLVSIVVTCFNQAHYLERSVNSVIAQTFTDLECIIVDDGSTDNTQQIAERLMNVDSRVKYFFKENGGVSDARNFGIQQLQGDWVQFLDGDDWLHENKISFQLNYLSSLDTKNLIFYSDYERVFMDESQNVINRHLNIVGSLTREQLIERLLIPDFLASTPFPLLQQCMLMNRMVFTKKKFDERLKALQDRDFPLDLLVEGVHFVYTPIVGAFYTKHQFNRTNNWSYMKNYYIIFYEIVYEKHKRILNSCQIGLEFLINETIREKDKYNFKRLARMVQPPVCLLDGKIEVKNLLILKLCYLIRLITPSFLLYEKYRGPRSKKILSKWSKIRSFKLTEKGLGARG